MGLFKRPKAHTIEPPEADAAHRAGRLVIVDVRGAGERAEGHPPGSRHLPLDELPARLGELSTDRPIAFICKSGRRSGMAAQAARRAGLDAKNVAGGMLAWETADLDTEKGST